LEVHDIVCHIADSIVSGGIRRSALIVLFDNADEEMLTCKGNIPVEIVSDSSTYTKEYYNTDGSLHTETRYNVEIMYRGQNKKLDLSEYEYNDLMTPKSVPGKGMCHTVAWWMFESQRGRSNNSAVFFRKSVKIGEREWKASTREQFDYMWECVKASGAGEPGIFWTNHPDWGANPCCEISLKSREFCNLTEINVSTLESQTDLLNRVWAATLIGTLQASYNNFHYISSKWRKNQTEEALLGVSLTGICDVQYKQFDFKSAADHAVKTNQEWSRNLGINSANRITTIKPSGNTSSTLGTASGIHARHSKFYLRRIRYNRIEPIAGYLQTVLPDLCEPDRFDTNGIVFTLPIESPSDSQFRSESALDFLERVAWFTENWIASGHVQGENMHNVSATVSIKSDEWDRVGDWMWENRNLYTGLSVLPYDGHTYVQAPYEECDKETYDRYADLLGEIDLTQVREDGDLTQLMSEAACAGGACEII
jgi:ribonucleoside-diphosphate reductase alpha chain